MNILNIVKPSRKETYLLLYYNDEEKIRLTSMVPESRKIPNRHNIQRETRTSDNKSHQMTGRVAQ